MQASVTEQASVNKQASVTEQASVNKQASVTKQHPDREDQLFSRTTSHTKMETSTMQHLREMTS